MSALPISTVRQDLFGLVKKVNEDHDQVTVVTKTGENAVLMAESDWNSIMETLYVLQTHGGAQLLASARDAREGRTEAHALIDPDEETSAAERPARAFTLRRGDVILAIEPKAFRNEPETGDDVPDKLLVEGARRYAVVQGAKLWAIAEKFLGDDVGGTSSADRFRRFMDEWDRIAATDELLSVGADEPDDTTTSHRGAHPRRGKA
ncbi:type II toxin-antitoxin system Phd/YefM family antitoxin [Nocardia suismassiliense]|uniref:type II toxin-antitoxin system Phd/YefM family antitoxin n=1 Tax=Nocardia suismassiliense TaxID=2077092 RepID=UPI000D1F3AD2|nr:type II toxin-antitoxin system Phd/YefM family antitoxin [Nocardia suismassiliense]